MMSVKNHQTPPTIRPERDLNTDKIMHIFLFLTNREKEEMPSIGHAYLKVTAATIVFLTDYSRMILVSFLLY
jgi:hypothetical protein